MIDPVLPWNWDRCANGREQKEDYENHLDHIHLCIFYFYLLLLFTIPIQTKFQILYDYAKKML
jgi:hypothetical protein